MNPSGLNFVITAVSVIVTTALSVAFLSVVKLWLTRKRMEFVPQRGYDPEALAQLQASVDAISLEVERISEGQRFTTRLLTERVSEQAKVTASTADTQVGQ